MKRQKNHSKKNLMITMFLFGSFVRPVNSVSTYKTIRAGVFFSDGFFESKDVGYSGYGYDIYINLAKINRYRYEFIECSLADCFEMLANNEIDILSGIQITDEREDTFEYTSIPMGVQSGSVIIRDGSIPYGMLDALQDKKIGFVFGEYHSLRFLDFLLENKISLIPDFRDSFDQVKKRFDNGLIDGYVSHNLDPAHNANRIYDFDESYMYLIARKGNIPLVKELNEGLAILSRNGIIKTSQLHNQTLQSNESLLYLVVIFALLASFGFSYYVVRQQKQHQKQIVWRKKHGEILNGLQNNDFFVVYQPIVDINNRSVSHMEALIRWNHDVHGLLPPLRFLDDINQCNLMFELFTYTLHIVLKDYVMVYSLLPAFQNDGFHISINITYEVLIDGRFIERVERLLSEYHCDGSRICFEITEQMEHDDVSLFNAQLTSLRALGCKVAMDDFGMEYSSLLTLKQSDYDIYKIDKYFVDEILTDKTAQSIALAILAIGHLLDKQVVAEGVETAAQVNQLYGMDCYLIQGYYFSKPMAIDALLDSLHTLQAHIEEGVPYVSKR